MSIVDDICPDRRNYYYAAVIEECMSVYTL